MFGNNGTLVSYCRNPMAFWKFRSAANSHQKDPLSPPNFAEQLMNLIGQDQSRFSKQPSVTCGKPKPNYCLKSLFIRNESGFVYPNSTNFSQTVWASQGTIVKNKWLFIEQFRRINCLRKTSFLHKSRSED